MRLSSQQICSVIFTVLPARRCCRTVCNRSSHGVNLEARSCIVTKVACRFLLHNRVWIILIACIRSIEIVFWLIDTLGHLDQKCCRILFVPMTAEKMRPFSRSVAHSWAALVFNALVISIFWKIRRMYRKTCQRWCPLRLGTSLINHQMSIGFHSYFHTGKYRCMSSSPDSTWICGW